MAPLPAMSNKDWNEDDDLLELGPADQVGKNKRGDAHANGEDELLSLDGPGKKRRSPKHRRGCLGTILYFFGVLILLGGLAYTLGMIPFAKRKKNSHFIWHIFVLVGAVLHWFAIYFFIY